ncbi:MAG: orotate phosphoribosyltransferase [Thermomicrobiales bacterium]
MPQIDVFELLRTTGALKTGHFLLSSGRHSDVYVEKFDLLRQPVATSEVCTGFVERFGGADVGVDVVVGPTTGGILLAFETARQMGVAAAYAEHADDGNGRALRRGTVLAQGARVLLVDDILTTGGSIRETLDAIAKHPVEVVGIGVLVDRSAGKVTFGDIPMHALGSQVVESWLPDECPLCAKGEQLIKPGTTIVS